MKMRTTVIFSVLTLSASLFSAPRPLIAAETAPDYFTIPQAELLDAEFSATRWGGTVERADSFDETVLFTFSGLSSSSTGLKDDYPVAGVYGQVLPSHGSGDFTNFDGCVLWVRNLDAAPVSVSLFINTGFTGPSGIPSNTWQNDTFWQSPWTQLQPNEARTLKLEFDNATPWNISDNPHPHTQGFDGAAMSINDFDRAEVSAIGFQVYADANPEAPLLVAPAYPPICSAELIADFDNDCRVTFKDLATLADQWLDCTLDPPSDC